MNLPRNLQAGLLSLITVVTIGTLGFMLIGDLGIGDAAYLTLITITTLGFAFLSEPLTGPAKLWLVLVLIFGMGSALYTLTTFMEYGFEIVLGSDYRRRRKMTKEISRISDHVIICGYGRVGAAACETLRQNGIAIVAIERDADVAEEAMMNGVNIVEGDATRDEVLIEAGLLRARSVVASVASSSDNLVITLSAKAIRSDVTVTARAVDHQTEKKLTLAGADAVVTPEQVGGVRLAAFATQPGLTEFVDTIVRDSPSELRIKRVVVTTDSPVVGESLTQLDLRRDSGAMIIGIAAQDEPMRVNPDPTRPFEEGDVVFGVGDEEQLARLQVVFQHD